MRKCILFAAVTAFCLAGCTNFKKGNGGSLYKIVEKKDGPTIKEGDVILLNGLIKNDDDSVMNNTYVDGHPAFFALKKSDFDGDLNSNIKMLSEGDSAVFKINLDTIAAKTGQPKPATIKGTYIVYTVRIEKVFSKSPNEADSVFAKRIKTYLTNLDQKSKIAEPGKIKKYIADNKLSVTTTASGLNYTFTAYGTGPHPAVGDTCLISYSGMFTTGKIFDTNIKQVAIANKTYKMVNPYQPIPVTIGAHKVIAGWEEGLMLLQKGAKAKFIIPSSLAYGGNGARGLIAPYTPLVYYIELVDIKHPAVATTKPLK